MKYTNIIDPHVHLRWMEYENWDFAKAALKIAKAVGIRWLIEMPNTTPSLIDDGTLCLRHDQLCATEDELGVGRSVHIGATTNVQQIINALSTSSGGEGGLKVYFTHSTGNMGILDRWWQRLIWQLAGERGYDGVILGHFEDEKSYGLPSRREWSQIKDVFPDLSVVPFGDCDRFYPSTPVSHSLYQHEAAETIQVRNQIKYAKECEFTGTFYICHVSSPSTVEYIESERSAGLDFNVVLEATWHHIFLSVEAYKTFGNHAKMNPPLRRPEAQKELLQMVLDGRFDLIGSDHAPHSPEKKIDPTHPASGVQALQFWPRGIELLRERGIDEGLLRRMTFDKAQELFDIPCEPEEVEVEYDKSLWTSDDPLSSV